MRIESPGREGDQSAVHMTLVDHAGPRITTRGRTYPAPERQRCRQAAGGHTWCVGLANPVAGSVGPCDVTAVAGLEPVNLQQTEPAGYPGRYVAAHDACFLRQRGRRRMAEVVERSRRAALSWGLPQQAGLRTSSSIGAADNRQDAGNHQKPWSRAPHYSMVRLSHHPRQVSRPRGAQRIGTSR